MTQNYEYIDKLRQANEKLVRDADTDSTNMQGFTLELNGHLFDSGLFNKSIDHCEKMGITFRVVAWDIGCDKDSDTAVTLQGLGSNEDALYAAEAEIIKMAETTGVKWARVKGPDYDKKLGVHHGKY